MSSKRVLVCQLVCCNKKHELLAKLEKFDKDVFKNFDMALNKVSDHMYGVDIALALWDSPIFVLNQDDFFLPVMNQRITELAAAYSSEFSQIAKATYWFYMRQRLLDLTDISRLERDIKELVGIEHSKMTKAWEALLTNNVSTPVFPGFEDTLTVTPPRYPHMKIKNSAYLDLMLETVPNATVV